MYENKEGDVQADVYNGNKTMTSDDDRKKKNYRLIIDPVLDHGHSSKIYRFEGIIPGDPDPEPVFVVDPRSRIKRYWNKKDTLDLPVPRFKHDVYYVGTILPKEVSFSNLNDNINQDFLTNMCKGFGHIEDSKIYHHPKSKKHLGIGKVVFTSTRSAKLCADKLNQTSRMGMIINAVVDPFGKERAKWVDDLTHDKNKPLPPSPVQKRKQDPRGHLTNSSESSSAHSRREEKHQQSRRLLKSNQKESCNSAMKSDNKECTHHKSKSAKHFSHEFHETNYSVSKEALNTSDYLQTVDSGNLHSKRDAWNEGLNDLHEEALSGLQDSKRQERTSSYKHKHRDRHSRNNYDHHRDTYNKARHRHRQRQHRHSDMKPEEESTVDKRLHEDKTSSDEGTLPKDQSELPQQTVEPVDRGEEEPKQSEEPRMQSLESRIQSLLGGIGLMSPGSQDKEAVEGDSVAEEDHLPPLPQVPAPPLPSVYPPPLPDEAAPPPLPPEPPHPHFIYANHKIDTKMNPLNNAFLSNGHPLSKRTAGEEDDRMSLSSIGSDEEKIEVNPPTLPPGLPPPPQPPLPPLPPMPWQLPPPIDPVQNPAFQNQITNSVYNQGLMSSNFENVPQQPCTFNPEDELKQGMFTEVLDQVINQLKFIMRKDLCKKMVQDTAFYTYDRWWTSEQKSDKVTKPAPSFQMDTTVDTWSSGPNAPVSLQNTNSLIPPDPFKQPTTGMSGTIEALFDNKDGSGFGVGGLLGLPGGIPKMPSFRKKFIKPLTPPPEEEDEDDDEDDDEQHEFLGPRTPEESESEEDKASDSGDDSISESDLKAFNEQRKRKVAIYSSDSDQSDSEHSARSDGVLSDSEEEMDAEDQSGSDESDELSDVDVETTSLQPPSPRDTPEPSPSNLSRQQAMARSHKAELLEGETQEIERATFPVLCKDSSDEDSNFSAQLEDESFMTTKAVKQRESQNVGMKGLFINRFQQPDADEVTSPIKDFKLSTEDAKEVQKQLEEKLEQQRQFAKTVSSDHCYHFKEEPKKRPRDPLPNFPQQESDLTDSASEGEPDMIPCLPANLASDHQYCAIYHPIDYALQYQKYRCKILGKLFNPSDFYSEIESVSVTDIAYETEISTDEVFKKYVNRTKGRKALTDVTNLKGSRELMSLLPPEVARKPKFKTRSFQEQQQCTYEFLLKGIEQEDINFLKRRYDELLQDDSPQTAWLNNVHWVEHSLTKISDPPMKRRRKNELRKHVSGCARTEGYYKISHREKSVYLSDARGVHAYHTEEQSQELILWQLDKGRKQKAQQMREARSESRRWQTVLSSTGEDVGDLVKFNQLKFRKKALKFAKSGIHDWGLFALEPIASDEMVIEYVGQTIRQSTADLREKKYEQMGIGSSYMFRIDGDNIIDATKCGNLARFINHSCSPNCYAKIISVEGQKKIVIYSKTEILVNEEITYDYKFPLEDEKIPCLCGTTGCRGSLN